MRSLIIFSMVFLCSGCMTAATYGPGDVSQQKFDRDRYECERDARMIQGGACTQMNLFESCMDSHGYQKIKPRSPFSC